MRYIHYKTLALLVSSVVLSANEDNHIIDCYHQSFVIIVINEDSPCHLEVSVHSILEDFQMLKMTMSCRLKEMNKCYLFMKYFEIILHKIQDKSFDNKNKNTEFLASCLGLFLLVVMAWNFHSRVGPAVSQDPLDVGEAKFLSHHHWVVQLL